jgi:hypothetical protein
LLHHSNSRTAAVARFPSCNTALLKAWDQGSGGCDLHHGAAFRVALTEART